MAKKSTYGFESVLARNKALATDLENLLLREMHYLGIESQGHARNNAGYTDRTGNLKNSIGYHVLHGSEEVASGSVARIIRFLLPMAKVQHKRHSRTRMKGLFIMTSSQKAVFHWLWWLVCSTLQPLKRKALTCWI